MFDNLSTKLDRAFKTLKGQGSITEINVAQTIKEVRRALVDADVNYKVAKTVTDKIKDEAMGRDIDVLNEEMVAAGVRIFVGGLLPAGSAKSVRTRPGGKVMITDGPYLETKEHMGGFWVLEAANMDEALAWGRKAAIACRAPVEVRQFH